MASVGSAEAVPAALPAGALPPVRDTGANGWTVAPDAQGRRRLWVLPAQAPQRWIEAGIQGVETEGCTSLEAEADGRVTLRGARGMVRFDPRRPDAGATRTAHDRVAGRSEASWESGSGWRAVARMPASNHDISAAVLGGRLYVAGGATDDWGFPRRARVFDEVWELDPDTWTWRTAAKLAQPRVYGATVAFGGAVWVIGGEIIGADGKRQASRAIEIFEPGARAVMAGPELPVAEGAPLALVAGERLYVLGAGSRIGAGRMHSLGRGERTWRREPDGPPHMWALAGATLDEKLYVCVPQVGLAMFDPASRRWSAIAGPTQPRSAQVAAWRGELWIVGGRDISDQREARIYDPVTRRWRLGPPLPRALAWGAAAVVEDQLVVTGGATGPAYVYSDQTFVLRAAEVAAVAKVAMAAPRPALETLPAWDDAALRNTGTGPLPVTTTRAFPELFFRRPVSVATVPVASAAELERLLVIESDGPITTFPNRPEARKADLAVLLDLPARFRQPTQTYALAFHPRFPAVPEVFVLYNRMRPKPAENVLARFTVTRLDPPRAEPASERVLLRWPSDGHNGGDLKFGPDGMLYVSSGDGGPPGDPRNVGQRVDLISGGILRLDVERNEGGKNHAVPADNPFVGMPGVRPEYWAYGLRNPWRMNFAPTGELWAGDNGDDSWESIQLIRRGHNYGWSVLEGSHPFKRTLTLAGPTPRATAPVVELSHAEARSVIGGLVYRGKAVPSLVGQYVFGDYVTGFLWAFRWDGNAARDFRRIADTGARPTSFGEERSGELLLTRLDGEIHRLAPRVRGASEGEVRSELGGRRGAKLFPRWLSETGLFASTAEHVGAPGVVGYEINAPLWSDGATVRRLLAVPAQRPIGGAVKTSWRLPEGSTLARTLELTTVNGPRRVETQVMHLRDGAWQFHSYAWNAEQTDAELVGETGETREVVGFKDRRWEFASRANCAICHTAENGFVLGVSTAQLNRDADYSASGGGVENQIRRLTRLGLLEPTTALRPDTLPRRVDPTDPHASLETRARSYLGANCAHCHRDGGVGGRATFQLAESLPLARTGLIDGVPVVSLLGGDARLVAPGEPERSELLHRLRMKEGGRMPLLGSREVDEAGVELVRAWILQMRK